MCFSDQEKQYFASLIAELKQNWIAEKEQQLANLNVKLQQIAERFTRLIDAYLDDQTIEHEFFEERKVALLFERRAVEDTLSDYRDNRTSVPEKLQNFSNSPETHFPCSHQPILRNDVGCSKSSPRTFRLTRKPLILLSPFRSTRSPVVKEESMVAHEFIEPLAGGPIRFSTGENGIRRQLLHFVIAADMIQIGMSIEYPCQLAYFAARLADLRSYEFRGIVSATSIHQQGCFLALQIHQLKWSSSDFTFEQVNTIKELLLDFASAELVFPVFNSNVSIH